MLLKEEYIFKVYSLGIIGKKLSKWKIDFEFYDAFQLLNMVFGKSLPVSASV